LRLIRAKQAIAKLKGENTDQEAGIKIVLRAMEEPLRQIVGNSGFRAERRHESRCRRQGQFRLQRADG